METKSTTIGQSASAVTTSRSNGDRCGSPAITGKPGCYFHATVLQRQDKFILPPLEDSNAIQFCVMEVMRGILEQRLDRATANTLLYALQIAHSNLRGVTVGQTRQNEDEPDSLAELLLRKLDDVGGHTDTEIGDALNRPRAEAAAQADEEPKADL